MTTETNATSEVGGVAGQQLKSIVDRIERLEEEKKGIADNIKDIYAEAKGNGFEPKIVRQIIRRRKMDREDRHEHDELMDLYEAALGME